MHEWKVIVVGIGFIGTVDAESPAGANREAMTLYGIPGSRPELNNDRRIYQDDNFTVERVPSEVNPIILTTEETEVLQAMMREYNRMGAIYPDGCQAAILSRITGIPIN